MIEVKGNALWPRFLREDKNGGAMCAAIKAGLDAFAEAIENGVKLVQDVETMPEWRLDEMARELNTLYDFSGTLEQKRKWIRDAMPNAMKLGTAKAIRQYLEDYFDGIDVVETGDFHFSVAVSGTLTPDAQKWLYKAVEQAKNVRSVFDGEQIVIDGLSLTIGPMEITESN